MSPEQILMIMAFLIALVVQAVKQAAQRRAPAEPAAHPVQPARVASPPPPPQRRIEVPPPEPSRPRRFAQRRGRSQAAARIDALQTPDTLAGVRERSSAAARLGLRRGDKAQLRRIVVLSEVLGRPRGERN